MNNKRMEPPRMDRGEIQIDRPEKGIKSDDDDSRGDNQCSAAKEVEYNGMPSHVSYS
jgi:hypothetical protein